LNPEEDAYGQEVWARFQGREVIEIVERDDGYIDPSLYNPKTYFASYEDWMPYHRLAMDYVCGRVLDIGCGAGRHTLYLQKQGFEVLGIDNSPLAIKVAKLRGVEKAQVTSIEEVNFQPGSFDTILLMGNNFGLLGSFIKAQTLLRQFHQITSKKGRIIADTLDPYETENPIHLEYHKHNRRRGRMGGQVRIRIRFSKFIGQWFDYLMVSKEEMRAILKGTGWDVKKFLDSEGSQYIAIIEKTDSE
jgi:SAM-dependent methyltransferase